MEFARIGVHESTAIDFPFHAIAGELADLDPELVPVGDDPDDLAACDAVVTFEHRDAILEAAPRWVHTTQAGVDSYPLDDYAERDIVLTNSTGLHGDRVGETAVGMMLSFARLLHRFARQQGEHDWSFPEWDEGFTLVGESVCVVGLGSVGGAVARKADALGMDVVGVRRSDEPVEGVDRLYVPDQLHEAVADARFVVLAVPLTDGTRHLVDADLLDAMREDAYLVNVARGGVVDEDALLTALGSDRLAGFAADVFETEPLPEDSPFWDREDVIVTPHAAVADHLFYEDMADLVRENVRRFAAGEEPKNRVV